MIAKLIFATMFAAGAVAAAAQEALQVPAAEAARAVWPHMHQCTLAPVGKPATATRGTGTSARPAAAEGPRWSRIDLSVAGTPDNSGGLAITAHAISIRGSGPAGRASEAGVSVRNPIGVACATSAVASDEAARTAAKSSFAFLSADGSGVGWSCSVSGGEDQPVFRIGLYVPPILGHVTTPPGKAAGASSNSPVTAVSIVPHGTGQGDGWHVACAADKARTTGYDLAVAKKV